MKRIICLVGLLIGLCACASADRSDPKHDELTEHALNVQAYLGSEPCWGEEWTLVDLNLDEAVPVYSAMYLDAYRGEDRSWEVSLSEPFSVVAIDKRDEWLLIEYAVSENERRIGWIEKPDECTLSSEKMQDKRERFNRTNAIVVNQTAVTDDPYGSQRTLTCLEADAEVECLGWVDAYYAYVRTVVDNRTAFGFVPIEDLAVPESLRLEDVEQELVGTWQFAGGAELLGCGIVLTDDGRYMLCSTNDFETFPPQNLMLAVRSSGRYEVVRNDYSIGEFWKEDAPYALILRDEEGGVQRYVMEYQKADGAQLTQDRLSFYAGEDGSSYGRMSGEKAEELLETVARTRVYRLEDLSDGWVHGKVGVTDRRYIRADVELDWEDMPDQIMLCEHEYIFEYDEQRVKSVIGIALPGSELGDGYYFEGELPEGIDCVWFRAVWEDGEDREILDLDVTTSHAGY